MLSVKHNFLDIYSIFEFSTVYPWPYNNHLLPRGYVGCTVTCNLNKFVKSIHKICLNFTSYLGGAMQQQINEHKEIN